MPKGHAGQMEKLEVKTLALQQELRELQEELTAARKGKKSGAKSAASVETWVPTWAAIWMQGSSLIWSWRL